MPGLKAHPVPLKRDGDLFIKLTRHLPSAPSASGRAGLFSVAPIGAGRSG
jgi:hypothetical protein